MKAEVIPDYTSSCTNSSNLENGQITQPELDQQLKNIISLIQVGLIDPKENPIIIGSPKDGEDEKPAKLTFCDKLKIIGILLFLIIVTVVVTLCIIYMFVPFFSKKSKSVDSFKLNSYQAIPNSSNDCEGLSDNLKDYSEYLGLIEFTNKNSTESKYCLGTLFTDDRLIAPIECLSLFKNMSNMSSNGLKDFLNEKTNEFLSLIKIIIKLQNNEDIKQLKRLNVLKISQANISSQDLLIFMFDIKKNIDEPTIRCLFSSNGRINENLTKSLSFNGFFENNKFHLNKTETSLRDFRLTATTNRTNTLIGQPYFLKDNSNKFSYAGSF